MTHKDDAGWNDQDPDRATETGLSGSSWTAAIASDRSRPNKLLYNPPDLPSSESQPSDLSSSGAGSRSSRRSRSPIKSNSLLRYANIEIRPVDDSLPATSKALVVDIIDIGDGLEVIPETLSVRREAVCNEMSLANLALIIRPEFPAAGFNIAFVP